MKTKKFIAADGHFKAIVELVAGENVVKLWEEKKKSISERFREWNGLSRKEYVLHSDRSVQERILEPNEKNKEVVELVLRYESGGNAARGTVTMVYLMAKDSSGAFTGPESEKRSLESGLRRVGVAGKMVQSMIADLMGRAGFGLVTFYLAKQVLVHRLNKTFEELRCLSDHELYEEVLQSLHRIRQTNLQNDEARDVILNNGNEQKKIDVAIMSFTRFDEKERKPLCHTALGGYPLALFGGGSMYSWPESVDNIPQRFLDRRIVDSARFFDDSSSRHQLWALASTSIGAILHEVGHCFGLSHATGKAAIRGGAGDVMGRGFDYINTLFLSTENGKAAPSKLRMPRWERSAAVQLNMHSMIKDWKKNEIGPVRTSSPCLERCTTSNENLHVKCEAGIRIVIYIVDGDVADHDEFSDELAIVFDLNLHREVDLRKRVGCVGRKRDVAVRVIDWLGSVGEWNLNEV